MMKKQIAAILAALLLCSAVGCTDTKDPADTGSDSVSVTETGSGTDSDAPEYKSGDIYAVDGWGAELLFPLKENMINYGADKFRYIYDTYLSEGEHEIRFSVIPDKSYFLAEKNGYPSFDYAALVSQLRASTDEYSTYVDLFPLLTLEDYYKTDLHWKQESIQDVAALLAESFDVTLSAEYEHIVCSEAFSGPYRTGNEAEMEADSLVYLTNSTLEGCTVTGMNTGKPAPVPMYDFDKATGEDAYELFMSGVDPLQVITNPNATTDKSLVIFRDSFTSSIAPLLAEGYKEITLIDLRFLRSDMIGQYVTFEDQDILFLYCTHILNNSMMLK